MATALVLSATACAAAWADERPKPTAETVSAEPDAWNFTKRGYVSTSY